MNNMAFEKQNIRDFLVFYLFHCNFFVLRVLSFLFISLVFYLFQCNFFVLHLRIKD